MSNFLASRGVLFTAWGVVVLLIAGGLTLAYVQPPPPPPTAEAVTVAVLPGPQPTPDVPEAQLLPEAQAEQQATQEKTGESVSPGAETTTPPPETVNVPLASDGASAETEDREEPAAETPSQADSAPSSSPVTTTLPKPKPEAQAEAATPEAPDAETPESTVSGAAEQSELAPDPDSPSSGEATAAEDPSGASSEEEQVVAIPLVPPAPEELAYWERYRQPFNLQDPRPRIAVVLTGLGLSDSATEAAITKLPSAVTLSFSPYARDLERWIALARSRGHEVMLDLPMEPATFPNEDPGPQGLLTSLTAEENLDRLDWVLSRGSAYVGLAGAMGSRFTTSRQDLEPILRDVKERGLIFLDRRTTENSVVAEIARELGLPAAINNRSVDERQASRVSIDARLAQIERIALTDGFAVAMAQPYPVTLDRLAEWATELTARGFAIAPISALTDQQTRP